MPSCMQKDVSFAVPEGWVDNSVVAYSAPRRTREANPPSVIVTRDRLAPRETLGAYSARQRKELARDLPGFRMVSEQSCELGGIAAVERRYSWNGRGGLLDQRQAMVARGGEVLTFTATVVRAESARLQPVFDRIFASVRFPEAVERRRRA